jgi:aspartate aminotransferase-like enzyme
VPLFYVDAVASVGGVEVLADDWGVDLCLAGTQKALSAPPDLGLVAVSAPAWEVIAEVGYQGYDALLPFRDALSRGWFPYTPSWGGLAALGQACSLVLQEGLEQVFARHARAAARCRELTAGAGLSLYPKDPASSSPTVTALRVPDPPGWQAIDAGLRQRGVALGGSLGPLSGKVLRLGHMGSQADVVLVVRGMAALAEVLVQQPG